MTARMARSTRGDDYQDVPRPVAALADEYPPNSYDPPHSHKRGQLVYAISGAQMRAANVRALGGEAGASPGAAARWLWGEIDRKQAN